MEQHNLDREEIFALYKVKMEKAVKKVEKQLEGLNSMTNKKFTDKYEFTDALEEAIGKEQTAELKPVIMELAYYKTNLELVRYFNPKKRDSGEFGQGWHLLIPYQIKPEGSAKREFLNVRIPEKMAVENLFMGEKEVLTFSTDRYSSAGYVPEKLESSQVVGLFMMTDASYRLADKLGNEFWFNQAGYLTDMIFSKDQHIHYEYLKGFTEAFDQTPYQVEPHDKERVKFLNVSIPKRMKIKDIVHGDSEILTFSNEGDFAGYVPENAEESRYKILALMSDASFRLVDKSGNESAFTPAGEFEKMAFSDKHPIVSSVSQGNQKIKFKYSIDKSGKIMIASANLSESEEDTTPTYIVKYQYDDEGRLFSVKGEDSKVAELTDDRSMIVTARK